MKSRKPRGTRRVKITVKSIFFQWHRFLPKLQKKYQDRLHMSLEFRPCFLFKKSKHSHSMHHKYYFQSCFPNFNIPHSVYFALTCMYVSWLYFFFHFVCEKDENEDVNPNTIMVGGAGTFITHISISLPHTVQDWQEAKAIEFFTIGVSVRLSDRSLQR